MRWETLARVDFLNALPAFVQIPENNLFFFFFFLGYADVTPVSPRCRQPPVTTTELLLLKIVIKIINVMEAIYKRPV